MSKHGLSDLPAWFLPRCRMQTPSSDEILSDKRVNCDKMEERYV